MPFNQKLLVGAMVWMCLVVVVPMVALTVREWRRARQWAKQIEDFRKKTTEKEKKWRV